MSSSFLRSAGVPVAAALAVLALLLVVFRLVDSSGTSSSTGTSNNAGGSTGAVTGAPGTGGNGDPGSIGAPEPPSRAPGPGTPDPDEPMSRFTSVTPRADGSSVDVRFWGGVDTCYRYSVHAREEGDTVTLRLKEESTFDGACIELAQEYDRTVRLDQPLGTRTVVDAVTRDVLLAPSP